MVKEIGKSQDGKRIIELEEDEIVIKNSDKNIKNTIIGYGLDVPLGFSQFKKIVKEEEEKLGRELNSYESGLIMYIVALKNLMLTLDMRSAFSKMELENIYGK